jgi:hypothetical protein
MFIDIVPPWALFFISSALVILAVEAGFRLGKSVYRREGESESPVSAIAGAILGMQAFMLGFTFSIVAERYDTKKNLVREEANAIRTVWQRADFLTEPDHSETKAMLKRYIDIRIADSQMAAPDVVRSQVKESQELQHRMWAIAVFHGKTDLNSDIGAMYVDSINQIASIQAMRLSLVVWDRVPSAIWIVLFALLVLGMAAVGYHTAIVDTQRSRITFVLALSFSLVIALIAVLDHPMNQIISIPQEPLTNLQAEIESSR